MQVNKSSIPEHKIDKHELDVWALNGIIYAAETIFVSDNKGSNLKFAVICLDVRHYRVSLSNIILYYGTDFEQARTAYEYPVKALASLLS
jgi:hypothetical protein